MNKCNQGSERSVYSKLTKTLIKEIEGDTNKWKDILRSWVIIINIGTNQSHL